MKRLLGAVLVLGLALPPPARAGEEDDLARNVDDQLSRIKDKLDGIAGDSSSGDIDAALDSLDRVKEYVDKLKALDPQGEPAKTMASAYPDWIPRFRESARALKQMKDAQVKGDESRLAERCAEADRTLRSFMQAFVERKDPAGASRIPDEAEKAGRNFGDELKKLLETHAAMDGWRSTARSFSESHGRWADVRSELADGASEIWDRWSRRVDDTKAKCSELAKGKESDAVKDAMSKLGNQGQAVTALRKKIDEKLQATASRLKDLDSKSGDAASELQDAQRSVDELLGLLGDLKDTQDRDAREIAERWPSQARSLKESIDAYKKLKAGQDYLDPDVSACQRELDELRTFLGLKLSAEGRKNPQASASEVRARAEAIQKKWLGKKDDADKLGRDLGSFKDKAASFSFREGEWSRVADALQGSAGRSLASFNTKRAQVYDGDPCRQLQLGVSARDVDQALKSLGEHRGTIGRRYADLKTNFKAWKQSANVFRQTLADRSKAIREAICNGENWESQVIQITDGRISQFQSEWDRLHSQRDRLLNDVDQLINDSTNQTLPEFKRKIVEYLNPLQPARDHELRGAADPLVKAYIDNGNAEHDRRMADCDVKKVRLPDGTEPDCIRNCVVIEIKPNNVREMAKGGVQVTEYRDKLQTMFAADPTTVTSSSSKWSYLARCIQTGSDGKSRLVLDARLETYNFCPGDDSMFFSTKEPLLNWEPPDSVE